MDVPDATDAYVGVVFARSSHANPSANWIVASRIDGLRFGVIDWMYP